MYLLWVNCGVNVAASADQIPTLGREVPAESPGWRRDCLALMQRTDFRPDPRAET